MTVETCTICFCEIGPSEPETTLPCKHQYHRECIQEFVDKKLEKMRKDYGFIKCPNCRQAGKFFEHTAFTILSGIEEHQKVLETKKFNNLCKTTINLVAIAILTSMVALTVLTLSQYIVLNLATIIATDALIKDPSVSPVIANKILQECEKKLEVYNETNNSSFTIKNIARGIPYGTVEEALESFFERDLPPLSSDLEIGTRYGKLAHFEKTGFFPNNFNAFYNAVVDNLPKGLKKNLSKGPSALNNENLVIRLQIAIAFILVDTGALLQKSVGRTNRMEEHLNDLNIAPNQQIKMPKTVLLMLANTGLLENRH